MVEYKGEKITLTEGEKITVGDYTVTAKNGLVFNAETRFGDSYALNSEDALKGAKELIDRSLSRG